jgi:D-alanyl-lipoteichoic acid acyltransferase DltB (MBOAT superfamily)
MLWGFFKTIVISDRLAIIVNSVNGNLEGTPGTLLLINFFVQFFYLYFNFSGYTDIVLGISKVFQVDLLNNFNRPLFATSVSDYWRRWHISLTTWCNDYIFKRIILKRIKWGQWASVYAVIITFLIIGIWHGANWNFIILGLLQGLAINYEFFTRKQRSSLGQKIPLWLNLTLSRLFTLIFICVSHVFFFTKDIQEALFYLSNMFQFSNPNLLSTNPGLSLKDMVIVSSAFLLVIISEFRDERGMKSIKTTIIHNKIYFFLVVAVAVAVLLLAGIFKGSGFIYEQF